MNKKLLPWFVCITGGLLFFYEFIQLNMLNSLGAYLMADFHLNATQLGHLSSTYFYANASLVFVAGILLDRFSTRKLILFAMLSCTFGTLGFALSPVVWGLGVARFFVGIGGAFCFLSAMRLASRWFPPSQLAFIVGLVVTMAMLGGMVAQTPLTLLCQAVGWREATLINAGLGFIITAMIYFWVQDYPQDSHMEYHAQKRQLSEMGFWTSVRLALTNPQNWLCALYAATMNLPIYILGALWGISYLQQVEHFSAANAATICGMIYLGTVFGSPFSGWASDKLRNRRYPMILGAVVSMVLVWLILNAHFSIWQFSLMFFLLGFVTSTQIISYPTVTEHNPRIITGTSVAIISLTIVLSGAVMQPFFGWIMDHVEIPQWVQNVPVYSAGAYHRALLMLPIMFIISLLCAFLIKETHCKQLK